MINKIKPEELHIFQTLRHPKAIAEILFDKVDDLSSFSPNEFGKIRDYQIPFLSFDSLFLYNKNIVPNDKKRNDEENFKIKKGLSEMYALGGRLTGKSRISLLIDCLCAIFNKTFKWGVISSSDLNHVRGVMEDIVISLKSHPIIKQFKRSIVRSPSYVINTTTGCKLETVNNNLKGKEPGSNWWGKHIDKNWEEEASFLTQFITNKKMLAMSELGCINRYSGMTTFSPNSPMGKIFNDFKNRNKIVNLPSYVNPHWNEEFEKKAIEEFNGKNSSAYQVQIVGKVISHGDSVFDMERIRDTYKYDKRGNPICVKQFEISKDNFYNYKDILILDKHVSAEKTIIALDKGEGAAPTEIIILFLVNGKYQYKYNITNFKLKLDEDEEIINYVIDKLDANVIAIDITSGTGKSLFSNLSKKYPENLVGVSFNEKINVDIERDSKGNFKYDNNGQPIYKKEYITDWSIQQLKDIFYNKNIIVLYDSKLDSQFNGVTAMKSGIRTIFKYKTANHLFQAFQVFAIAHWQTKLKIMNPIPKRELSIGVFKSV